MLGVAVIVLSGALAAFTLVEVTRRYALRQGVLDVPNERSSHVRPTPRGGGIGVVVPVAAAMTFFGLFPSPVATAGAAMAVIVAATVGWVDDYRGLSVAARLPLHVVAGTLVGVSVLVSGSSTTILLLTLLGLWWVFWTVSAINVVNFMDGSDAMIGLQGLLFSAFASAMLPSGSDARAIALVATGAFIGFLALNRPPARIFLGDVGSGAVGVIFVLLGVVVMRARSWSVVAAYLPLAPLFIDEFLTMVRRIREGCDLRVAHRTHYYQRLIQAGWGHGQAAVLFGGLSLLGALTAALLGGRLGLVLLVGAAYTVGAGLVLHGLTRWIEGADVKDPTS